MNKQDFIDRIAAKTQLSKADVARAVEAFLETVTEALRQGEEVTFIGFGKFSVQQRKARDAVNPSTRQKIRIPASKVPKFSAGALLKAAVK
ncbi:MAG TPA: HU family DNA-binding protein [Burkholderiaceae bacterium]|nr:HU family DNA-binding protein [Burkholderiaceae bacterium]